MDEIVKIDVPRVVRFTVPYLTPPSVNHYKIQDRKTGRWYVTAEGIAFKQAVCLFSRGETVAPIEKAEQRKVRYGLYITVYQGKNERGDGDNYWKCIADGLEDARVIHSDAFVEVWYLRVDKTERDNPRTKFRVARLRERR